MAKLKTIILTSEEYQHEITFVGDPKTMIPRDVADAEELAGVLFSVVTELLEIKTKREFRTLWEGDTSDPDPEKAEQKAVLYSELQQLKEDASPTAFFVFLMVVYRLEIGNDFDFAGYILSEISKSGVSEWLNTTPAEEIAVKLTEKNARLWHVCNRIKGIRAKSEKTLKELVKEQTDGFVVLDLETDTAPDKGADVSGVPSSMETDKGDLSKEEVKRNEENADTEKEPKTPVSYDFYKILEVVKVDEKTKQILEFLALEFGDAIRNFTKNAPQLKAPQKADLIRGGAWDLSDIIKPIVLTPREWAGRLYPEYMKERGVTKAIKKTLTAFAPLQNATIVREVIDEKTGQLVKRVTPVFMIEYDFKDGTPDDVINKFRSNPLEFLKNEETGAENLINIRVRPSAPLITNQYNDVNGGSVWRKYILGEKSEDRTKGARRLGVLNVPKVKTDKILKVEEMAKDTQTRPAKQTALFGDIAETARKVYGSNYQYDAKKKIFVDPDKAEEKPKKTEAKQKAETATRPARQTKGRGRPKKEK